MLLFFAEETLEVFHVDLESVRLFISDCLESDHVFFASIAGVQIVGIIIVEGKQELSDTVSLVIV